VYNWIDFDTYKIVSATNRE